MTGTFDRLWYARGNTAGDFATMAAEVTSEEFIALEREVEGEKLVTRHILEQTRRNGDDLAGIKTRLARVEEKVDGLDRKVDSLDQTVKDLAKSLPTIVAETMREVQRERDA